MDRQISKKQVVEISNNVLDSVSEHSKIALELIRSKKRNAEIVRARAVFFCVTQHLIQQFIPKSSHRYNQTMDITIIAPIINRDYTSLIHHFKMHDSNMRTYPEYASLYRKTYEDSRIHLMYMNNPYAYVDAIPQF